MNKQRIILLITGVFLIAASVGSACYYRLYTGFAFPFCAPLLLLPASIGSHPRWWMVSVVVALLVVSIGSAA